MHEGTMPTPPVEIEPNRDECVVAPDSSNQQWPGHNFVQTRISPGPPACRSFRMLAVPRACPTAVCFVLPVVLLG
jgi:hypothetical protein